MARFLASERPDDFDAAVSQRALNAISDAEPIPFWTESVDIPDSNPTLVRNEHCDLCIVGGGYTGLWAAVIAKERDPSRDVVLIDKGEVGGAASGRNGGFMESSLTHGVGNGLARHADEIDVLEELGLQNLNQIEAAIERYDIDCGYERTGVIDVAHTGHPASYVDELREEHDTLRSMGQAVDWLDTDAMRAEVDSPTYVAGLFRSGRAALVDPARLAWGLKRVAESLGVRIYEHSKATDVETDGVGTLVTTPLGKIRCAQVVLGTNADKPLLKRVRRYMVPVYDYCLVTEPLTAEQMASIGWEKRQGLSDITNQFHYYRLTADNRILWGGYDAIYYWGSKTSVELESRPETWAKLSEHFFETFPQLEDVAFSHVWGGAIDTSTRFSVFFGSAMQNRVVYAVGYTGLGVAATRFAASTMLDLLQGRKTIATQTDFVRSKPLPFPPEPFRFAGIQATRWSMDREDQHGRRNAWLRTLDRLGLGFDS
ncbi:MAG: FAD-dependent oxidoreductase [Ilumatobacter sp.]|uniref:NAD(P)/FAD-dependent oxidoreductase n=1 Tax=Ilumatobacter sp. TaxID=1967498 RepID=UPI0032984B81